MKLVENDQIKLKDVVSELIKNSNEIRLAIAFVRKSGVDLLNNELQDFKNRGGKLKLIFGEDFNLTDGSALEELLNQGAEMKLYLPRKGVYHPKIWIFKLTGKWSVVIGSSNLSKDALTNNIEASVVFEGNYSDPAIKGCLSAYETLWKSDRCYEIGHEYISNYKNEAKKYFKRRISIPTNGTINLAQSYNTLKDIIKSWIDIPVDDKFEDNSVWRGWYFLPNQTVITIDYLGKLQKILVFIKGHREYKKDGYLAIGTDAHGIQICKNMYLFAGITFQRRSHKLNERQLFIRQQKNYLEKFEFITEADKKISLTKLGDEFSCANKNKQKAMYETILIEYKWYDIHPFLFIIRLLLALESNTMSYDEFSFFVVHTKHDAEFDAVYDSIIAYRLLAQQDREKLIQEVQNLLQTSKGGSQKKMVIGDYNLKIKFFLEDISVFNYLNYDSQYKILKLTDVVKGQQILDDSDYP